MLGLPYRQRCLGSWRYLIVVKSRRVSLTAVNDGWSTWEWKKSTRVAGDFISSLRRLTMRSPAASKRITRIPDFSPVDLVQRKKRSTAYCQHDVSTSSLKKRMLKAIGNVNASHHRNQKTPAGKDRPCMQGQGLRIHVESGGDHFLHQDRLMDKA